MQSDKLLRCAPQFSADAGYAKYQMINRGAIIVRPKEPYIDWAIGLDDSGLKPGEDDEHTIYLIPEYENDLEAIEVLSKCFDIIFETELQNWHTDESAWPKNRTFSMFRKWFGFEFHSCVDDLCGYEIIDDDYA